MVEEVVDSTLSKWYLKDHQSRQARLQAGLGESHCVLFGVLFILLFTLISLVPLPPRHAFLSYLASLSVPQTPVMVIAATVHRAAAPVRYIAGNVIFAVVVHSLQGR